MNRLDGKVALISGASRGIGAETARCMGSAGARVVVADILGDEGRRTAQGIASEGGQATFVDLDVTSEAAWSRAIAEAIRAFGQLDILVNNAGIFLGRDFEEATLEEWHRLVAVNLTGVFLGTKMAAPALREAGRVSPHGSAIVNLSSIAGVVGSPFDPLYSMTKGGVTLFTKSTALSFARKGDRIRVNSVHPGVVDTEMGAQNIVRRMAVMRSNDLEAAREATRQVHPIGRLGEPNDIAQAIVFLASDDARFITGSAMMVDGGLTAQ
jgi:NAD(P)-dependent dehydrogenase (short-subunit alcohol dehydrogenase family)